MTSVLALVGDLIFSSRIVATGRAAGVAVEITRSVDDLVARIDGARPPELIIVDLTLSGEDPVEAIRRCTGRGTVPRVVAFGPHVRADLLEAARAAGADALPRSVFAARLPELLESATNG